MISIPRKNRCEKIAPVITPKPIKAPNQVVLGNNNNKEAINSTTPDAILPWGSILSFEKIKTDSGAAVNLKNNV